MDKLLSPREVKEVFGEFIVDNKRYEIDVERLISCHQEVYLIIAIDPVTNKEIERVCILRTDTARPEMIARRKRCLMNILKRKE